eukprot:1124700-Pleurochrysis_carterae.AAC.1
MAQNANVEGIEYKTQGGGRSSSPTPTPIGLSHIQRPDFASCMEELLCRTVRSVRDELRIMLHENPL